MKLNHLIGTQVTLCGTAENNSLGAVVVLEDDHSIFIDGVRRWDKALYGKQVEVTGTLDRRRLAPEPVVLPDGGHTHGMVGDRLILDRATWKAIE